MPYQALIRRGSHGAFAHGTCAVGSRAQVWHGTAMHTSGGLYREDLFQDKYGNIKSKRASSNAKRQNHLKGYLAPKGSHTFKLAH